MTLTFPKVCTQSTHFLSQIRSCALSPFCYSIDRTYKICCVCVKNDVPKRLGQNFWELALRRPRETRRSSTGLAKAGALAGKVRGSGGRGPEQQGTSMCTGHS